MKVDEINKSLLKLIIKRLIKGMKIGLPIPTEFLRATARTAILHPH